MTEIPAGYKKSDLILNYENSKVKDMEGTILYFLVRDYRILYSKVPKFDDWTEIHFYCYPKDEANIIYRLGCYAQAVYGFFDEKYFKDPIHTVYEGFPGCIHIEAKYNEKHHLEIGPRAFEMGEARHEVALLTKIEDLDLSVRAFNCLKGSKINTVKELLWHSAADLLKYRNFGKKSVIEIEALLSEMGLALSTINRY